MKSPLRRTPLQPSAMLCLPCLSCPPHPTRTITPRSGYRTSIRMLSSPPHLAALYTAWRLHSEPGTQTHIGGLSKTLPLHLRRGHWGNILEAVFDFCTKHILHTEPSICVCAAVVITIVFFSLFPLTILSTDLTIAPGLLLFRKFCCPSVWISVDCQTAREKMQGVKRCMQHQIFIQHIQHSEKHMK